VWFEEKKITYARLRTKRVIFIIQYESQVPHCDGHNCNHLWLRFVTDKSGHNAAGFRKLQKSGFSWLFWDFLWRPAFILQNPSHYDSHKCDHLWRFCDSLKAVTMKTVKESFKSPSLSGFLWRLIAVTMRLVLESFKSLVLAGFFWDFLWFFFFSFLWLFFYFLWRPAFYYKIRHIMRVTNVTICDDIVTR
jgi:hypothetical protein